MIEHKIELTSSDSIKPYNYRVLYALRDTLKKEIDSMLEYSVIEESHAKSAFPGVLVREPVKPEVGLCIDFRA